MKLTAAAASPSRCVPLAAAVLATSTLQQVAGALLGSSGALTLRGATGNGNWNKEAGEPSCPCIGFSRLEGETVVELEDREQVRYPASLGASCQAWDNNRHPQCSGKGTPGADEGWCGQAWCYVDSCECGLLDAPRRSIFSPDVTYQGRPLFFSYQTCGSKDMYPAEKPPPLGQSGCRCVGFYGSFGSREKGGTVEVEVQIEASANKEIMIFPHDLGSYCGAWENPVHRLCKVPDPPDWCRQQWCFVDPCECNMKDPPPKVSMYLPSATFQGKSLYYSYTTCGSNDTFTENVNIKACQHRKTLGDCLYPINGVRKCAWTGTRCLGRELVEHPLCAHLDHNETEKDAAVRQRVGHLASAILLLLALFAA